MPSLVIVDQVSDDESARVRITGALNADAQTDKFRLTAVTLAVGYKNKTDLVETDLLLSEDAKLAVDIPGGLLRATEADHYRFANADDIKVMARHEVEALDAQRQTLKERLAAPLVLSGQGTVFGVKAFDTVEIRLPPTALDIPPGLTGDTVLFGLKACRKISLTLNGAADEISGELCFSFEIHQKDLAALADTLLGALDFNLPGFPSFDLDLPRFKLPELTLDSIDLDFSGLVPDLKWPSLIPISLPKLPGFGTPPIKAVWDPEPKFKLNVKDGKLGVETTTKGKVDITMEGVAALTVEDLALTVTDGDVVVNATYSGNSTPVTLPSVTLPDWLPLKVEIAKSALTFKYDGTGNPRTFTIIHKMPKISISARDDPSLFIHFLLEVSYSATDDAPDKIATNITRLKILTPYPIELISTLGEVVGDAIRLIGQIPLPEVGDPDLAGVRKVLERIIDLLGAAARWLAKQAEALGSILAGVAEAIAEAIKGVFRQLGQGAPGTTGFSFLALEVRLDPKSYRLQQVILMPAGGPRELDFKGDFLGFHLAVDGRLRPAMVLNFAGEDWFGLALLPDQIGAGDAPKITLSSDLWMKRPSGPTQPMGTVPISENGTEATPPRLVTVQATALADAADGGRTQEIVLAAIQNGKVKLFQTVKTGKVEQIDLPDGAGGKNVAVSMGSPGPLTPIDGAKIAFGDGSGTGGKIIRITARTDPKTIESIKNRALALLPKSGGDGSGVGKLIQRIEISDFSADIAGEKRSVALNFDLTLHLTEGLSPKTSLGVDVSLDDLSSRITGGETIAIMTTGEKSFQPLGLDLKLKPKPGKDAAVPWEVFRLDLSRGAERFALGADAAATLAYRRVATSGEGLVFNLTDFAASRAGFDLEARVNPENPVTLGGVNVPFRFTSGQLSIAGSKFKGASLAGAGQLPPALVGKANASIAMQLGSDANGDVEVLGATARLDKSGDPIRCNATMFELTVTELGFDYVREGSYHFYFLLTGSAVFRPSGGAFSDGLLKNFKELEIKLDKAPLGGDPRVLLRSVSFLIKVDPPKRTNFFNLFTFDLKGIGFYPAAEKFDGDPAMAISGQVKFAEFGDKISPRFDFHKMWIAGPAKGKTLPRVRFDGLTVGLKTGAMDVEATALAVDGNMPDLYRPDVLPANVSAKGFLAKGRLDISGWASMSGAMGFLELTRKDIVSAPRPAFFIYGQMNKLSVPIDTPVGTIYLREFGFGFGHRFTLAGIAQAEKATTPGELIRILDEVSKYQGNLDQFEAWEPTYDNSDLTLALRGMFSLSAANRGGDYNKKAEAELPNPVLFDIVAALRTDLTFLINLRGWLAVNYADWIESPTGEAFKSNPTASGYLYFSVPRKEFLARMVSFPQGHVGDHPKLPPPLIKAIRATRFSSTLYIRPGLFHMEFGWPYELEFSLGKPQDTFYLKLNGGLINRIEDFSLLYGMAFRAEGGVRFGGRIGNDNFGAAATAEAYFRLEAKILAYLSLQRFDDSLFYGMLRFDMTLSVRVSVWISFRIFRKRIRLSVGFSLHLAVSIGLEAVITPGALGGRAHVAVGVRAFGRTLSVGIGLSFNDNALNQARARVARFMALGLTTDVPPASEDGQRAERAPRPPTPRQEVIEAGDHRLEEDIGTQPAPAPTLQPAEEADEAFDGDPLAATNFWAMLFPVSGHGQEEMFLMQIVPRDSTMAPARKDGQKPPNTFYCAPRPDGAAHVLDPETGIDLKQLLHRVTVSKDDAKWPANLELPVKTGEIVEAGDPNLTLGDLMGTLFLRRPDPDNKDGLVFSEPLPRAIQTTDMVLPEDREASAQELGRIGRSRMHMPAQHRREAAIDESRSAVIAAVMETAELIAGALRAGSTDISRIGEIDARDFGLTFRVSRRDLDVLFEAGKEKTEPRKAKFGIAKADSRDHTGTVHLFNPPERMFREAQPRLVPTEVLSPEGIKLDWDLEPAWETSQSVYDDPEFHLKRYRIKRRITGLPGGESFDATFDCKAAAPTELRENGKQGTIATAIRPPYQFIDDLRMQDATSTSPARSIPQDVRDAILGLGHSPKWADDLAVEYDIQPIDIAGTTDAGEPFSVWAAPKVHKQTYSPHEATLQLVYDGFPTLSDADPLPETESHASFALPELRFLLRRPPDPGVKTGLAFLDRDPATDTKYDLRIFRDLAVPSGGYGSDAVTQGLSRPDQDQIEALSGPDISDFVLQLGTGFDPDTEKAAENAFVVSFERKEVPGEHHHFRARLFDADGKEVGRDGLVAALHAEVYARTKGAIDPEPGHSARLFLRALPGSGEAQHLRGEWRSVSPNIAVVAHDETGKRKPALAINATVETFEQPVALAFKALGRADMAVRSGRLHVFQPAETSKLGDLLQGGTDGAALILSPDPERRTATRLTWNARPESLALQGADEAEAAQAGASLFRLVSGFEVFRLDPDTLTGGDDNTVSRKGLAEQADNIGTLRLLPAAERGLSPDKFGDMSRLEMAFPSAAWRDGRQARTGHGDGGMSATPARRPWFSQAESTAIFPAPRLRRSIFPDLDEGLLAELFANGAPNKVQITIPAWKDKGPLDQWQLVVSEDGGEVHPTSDGWVLTLEPGTPTDSEGPKPFPVKELRRKLHAIYLKPTAEDGPAYDHALQQESDALRKRLTDPDHLGDIAVHLRALRFPADRSGNLSTTAQMTAQVTQTIDLMAALHPILADTLSRLAFYSDEGTDPYRRYSLVHDNSAPTQTKGFAEYLDEVPAERDPHGFAALRTLGLAAGFQVYDTETGTFLRGRKLFERINTAYEAAIRPYLDKGQGRGDLGLPFLDILTQAWGNGRFFWFDGGQDEPGKTEAGKLVQDDTLAAVQIALRPVADRVAMPQRDDNTRDVPVQLWQLLRTEKSLEQNDGVLRYFRITMTSNPAATIVDAVAPAKGVEALPIHRFGPETSVMRVGTGIDAGGVLAHLRVIRTRKDATVPPVFKVEAVYEEAGSEKAVLLGADGDYVLTPEIFDPATPAKVEQGMGAFTDLPPEDWARALFRPRLTEGDAPAVALSEVLAVERLGYYAGRRFGSLMIPQGDVEGQAEASAAVDARTELAAKITGFWQRFLDHTAVTGQQADNAVRFSLGTVADPGTWQQAPDSHGQVSIVVPDADRRGARRAFAVRPTGRYDDWARATDWHLRRSGTKVALARFAPPRGLQGALNPNAALKQFVHATLPRTEPLEKPVILSARRLPVNEGLTGEGAFEVAIAHPSDMVLAAANRRNAALLAPQDISVGLWREFAYPHWLAAALQVAQKAGADPDDWKPMAGFGSGGYAAAGPEGKDGEDRAEIRKAAIERLSSLRQVVPDAWQGTTVVTFSQTPYFFRIHVLVHVSAGIVVSDHARVSFDEGFPRLALPWDRNDGYAHRHHADPPHWRVVLDDQDRRILRVDWPLMRLIDAMAPQDADLWFGKDAADFRDFKKMAHLADPQTAYRLAIETVQPEGANEDRTRSTRAQSFEIDVSPISYSKAPDEDAVMYGARVSGANLSLLKDEVADPVAELGLRPSVADGLHWRLTLPLAAPEPAPAEFPISDDEGETLAGVQEKLTETDCFTFGYVATFGVTPGTHADANAWNDKLKEMDTALREEPRLVALADALKAAFGTFSEDTPARQEILRVPPILWTDDKIPAEVQAFFGQDIARGAPFLRMNHAPTNAEITVVADLLTQDRRAALLGWFGAQLFGTNRRLSVFMMRGALPPVSGLVRHELEGSP